jgi:hypothetical protein
VNMNDYFEVLNFQIPNDLKSFYESISDEFEKRVYDAIKQGEENEKD